MAAHPAAGAAGAPAPGPEPGASDETEALIQFLYMAPTGLAQTTLDGDIVMVNPLCAQLLMPLSPDGGLANLFSALQSLAPDLRQRVAAFAAPQGRVCEAMPLRLPAPPGTRNPVRHLTLTLMKLDASRLMAVLNDVTQSVEREQALRQHQTLLRGLASGMTEYALTTLDQAGRIEQWNSSLLRLTGHAASSVEGQSFALFYPEALRLPHLVQDRLCEADGSGWSLDEGWLQRADGSRFWGSCLVAPLQAALAGDGTAGAPGSQQPAYCLIIRDLGEQRDALQALQQALHSDHLTGLRNRRALYETAETELQRWRRSPRPLSLLLIDADHFKSINDRFGHAAGDAVLRHLAAGLGASLRSMDVPARLGGEEFVVLLPGTDGDGARAMAERLCRQVAAHSVRVNEQTIRYTVSVGVASMDATVADVDALIARADAAMYAAKAQGRNRVVCWSPALQPGVATA